MTIRPIASRIQIAGRYTNKYLACDGREFFDIEEVVEYDNKLHEGSTVKKEVTYDYVLSIQEAINMAVVENRVVRILSTASNEDIKKGIVDLRDCHLMKKDKESNDIAVVPPTITDFVF